MSVNQAAAHRCLWAVTCASIAVVTVIPLTAQQGESVELSVFDPRPLSAVIAQLETRYGWVITYEDPSYENPADLAEVSVHEVKDPKNLKAGVRIPRPRKFDFKYPNADRSRAEDVLAAVIRDYNKAGNNDAFRLVRTGKVFHVVPSVSDNKLGLPTNRESRLDVRVTIPDAERSVLQTLELILAHVGELTGVPTLVATVPHNFLAQKKVRTGATNERARDVLVRALASTGRDLSWRLNCGPNALKSCYFNLHFVEPPQ
jgi:hypothetical protein